MLLKILLCVFSSAKWAFRAPDRRANGGIGLSGPSERRNRTISPERHNTLRVNAFRPHASFRLRIGSTFGTLYGPKYKNNFFYTQYPHNVNSPLRGFVSSSTLRSNGRFWPSTYMSLVMAASAVMSRADSTPAARRRCPVS